MIKERKGIHLNLSEEDKARFLWFEKNGLARLAKIMTGRRVGDPIMAEEKLLPLSFGQHVVGFLFLALFILMIIFEFLPAIGRILQLFSGK